MVKIVHTADFHLGIGFGELESSQLINEVRLNDLLRNFEEIKNFTINNKADFLIIAGDVFHHPRPSLRTLNDFSKILGEIINNEIDVIITLGNHDVAKIYERLNVLRSFRNLNIKNLHIFEDAKYEIIDGKRSNEKVKFIGLPYPLFHHLYPSDFISKFEDKLNELINQGNNYDYLVIVGHFYVEGGKIGSERNVEPIVIREIPIPRRILERKEIDLVCLGHLHTSQEIGEKIFYSGSIERMDFSEENEEKSFLFINLKDKIYHERIKLPMRPMKTIPSKGYIEVYNSLNPEQDIIKFLEKENIEKESILRIMLMLGENQRKPSINVLDKYLKEKRKVLAYKIEFLRRKEKESIVNLSKKSDIEELLTEYLNKKYKDQELAKRVKEEAIKIMKEHED
jgi:exonuclease SbcD